MAEIEETPLPGVGIRYHFATAGGRRLGVLVHRTGRRELLLYSSGDPDECVESIALVPDDTRTLSELLGASRVVEQINALQQVAGIGIDWIEIQAGGPWAGLSLAEAAVHSRTGASVVALLRGHDVVASPGATDILGIGETVVAVGTPSQLAALEAGLVGT
jgi:TrkA domain protein